MDPQVPRPFHRRGVFLAAGLVLGDGRIGRSLAPQLAGIFVLGGLQGAVGWWMVASGLSERTDVSQYRLAVHLTLAFAIYALVIWVARGLRPRAWLQSRGRGLAAALWCFSFVQVFLGGLVAGLDAGLVANTWPTMDGEMVPHGLFVAEPWWRNIFENPVTAQFDHRMMAYLILVLALVHAVRMRGTAAARRRAGCWCLCCSRRPRSVLRRWCTRCRSTSRSSISSGVRSRCWSRSFTFAT